MWNGINGRKFPRIKAKIDAEVMLGDHTEYVSSYTENIGVGGICLILDKKVDNFSKVKLQLALDDGLSAVDCNGRVVWIVEKRIFGVAKVNYDVGIEFVDLKTADAERIKNFIVNTTP